MDKFDAVITAENDAKLLGKLHSVIEEEGDFKVVKGYHNQAVYDTKKGWLPQ